MRKIIVLFICISIGFFLISCVTTTENSGDTVVESIKTDETESTDKPKEKNGIIYNSRELAEGPLLLGSTEYLEGPVVEFNILYSLYFPLSGILFPDHQYKISQGTRWEIESEKLLEDVYFERALLSEDDEGKTWWYFKVEGDGFLREFEFLLNANWDLLVMNYLDKGRVKSYIPSVDELNNLSNGKIIYEDFNKGKENIETSLGSLRADHIVSDTFEHWISTTVPGNFLKSIILVDGETVLTASLIEVKEDYNTIMESF